jgi:hypothetical protein
MKAVYAFLDGSGIRMSPNLRHRSPNQGIASHIPWGALCELQLSPWRCTFAGQQYASRVPVTAGELQLPWLEFLRGGDHEHDL